MQLEGKQVVIGRGSRIGRAFAITASLALGACHAAPAATTPATAATASSPNVPSLVGTWTLTAADDLLPDGKRVPAYGAAPRGVLMIDRDGRYSLQIFRSDRRKFAGNDKRHGTPEEYEAAVLGMSSHIGHCAINPTSHTLDFHIDVASYANWDGTVQKRAFTLAGDELSYQVPANASGIVPISVWRRVQAP